MLEGFFPSVATGAPCDTFIPKKAGAGPGRYLHSSLSSDRDLLPPSPARGSIRRGPNPDEGFIPRVPRASAFLLCLLAGGSTACVGAPTPLAPNLTGSVGVPQSGVLVGGEALPVRGPGFVRLRPKSPNYFGTPRMVHAIEDAAKLVAEARPGGSPLYVGDISAPTGGKIPGHASHRSGRDADLLYYVTTPGGAPIPSAGFVRLGTDGLGKPSEDDDDLYIRLDVERQWLLVKALLENPNAEVEWMFASRGVEALLIDYARARGEDPALVWHAESVLLQPGDSTPHDDHMHLRLACSADEAVAGCEGGGPHWDWLERLPSLGELGPEELRDIADDDPLGIEQLAQPEQAGGGDV